MNERLKILEMIEKGQITAAEGMELLEALNMTDDTLPAQNTAVIERAPKRNYKYFKIKVTSENQSVNVNVNIPLRLITTIGELAGKMITLIPADARREMENKGIDITTIDFGRIIGEIIDGTQDDPNIIDVEAWDEEHKSMVKVKIYVE